MRADVADLQVELENPGPRAIRSQRGAERIRQARAYRWVGIYDVTPSEMAAIAWTGPTAPAFPRFPRSLGLSGAVIVGTLDVESDQPHAFTAEDVSFLEACASILMILWESSEDEMQTRITEHGHS